MRGVIRVILLIHPLDLSHQNIVFGQLPGKHKPQMRFTIIHIPTPIFLILRVIRAIRVIRVIRVIIDSTETLMVTWTVGVIRVIRVIRAMHRVFSIEVSSSSYKVISGVIRGLSEGY